MNNWVFWFKHLITITLKTFLKHTRQRQIACFLLLCKQGNLFNTFFREQFFLQTKNKKKTVIKIDLVCFLAVIHTLIKKLLYYEEIFNNILYIQERKNKM